MGVRHQFLVAAATVAALGGCAGFGAGGDAARRASAFDSTQDASCYTVDLFTEPRFVAPGGEVPRRWRDFAGVWGGGAWNGVWCHDLYILEVKPDGLVRVIETHAPHEPWGKRATAFQRTGRIGSDGRLRLRYGQVEAEYWVEDGVLYGLQNDAGDLRRIALTRRTT
jgi:hypothetical protein